MKMDWENNTILLNSRDEIFDYYIGQQLDSIWNKISTGNFFLDKRQNNIPYVSAIEIGLNPIIHFEYDKEPKHYE